MSALGLNTAGAVGDAGARGNARLRSPVPVVAVDNRGRPAASEPDAARGHPSGLSFSTALVRAIAAMLVLIGLGACSAMRESQPGRTATEQLLISTAIDRVCDQLAIRIPEDSEVFVDARYVEGPDSKYLVATLRDRILRRGGRLVTARGQADLILEPRIGALSVDRKSTLLGLPSLPVPILPAGSFDFPELALFKRARQQGVVKLALTIYNAESGELRQSLGPAYGFSQLTDTTAMMLVSWQSNDLMPAPANDDWIGEGAVESAQQTVHAISPF